MLKNEEDLDKFQVIENKVYRAILKVPTHTANEAIRGYIGSSTFKARDMKSKILFAKK